jgi:hypothetical protein
LEDPQIRGTLPCPLILRPRLDQNV